MTTCFFSTSKYRSFYFYTFFLMIVSGSQLSSYRFIPYIYFTVIDIFLKTFLLDYYFSQMSFTSYRSQIFLRDYLFFNVSLSLLLFLFLMQPLTNYINLLFLDMLSSKAYFRFIYATSFLMFEENSFLTSLLNSVAIFTKNIWN